MNDSAAFKQTVEKDVESLVENKRDAKEFLRKIVELKTYRY